MLINWFIVSAFDEKYVSQTLNKVWQELDFLNTSTQGGFRRVRMKIDTDIYDGYDVYIENGLVFVRLHEIVNEAPVLKDYGIGE